MNVNSLRIIGTRIVYDRNALLLMRNSPLSKTPPVGIYTPVFIHLDIIPKLVHHSGLICFS
jgi:hypothetical protein